jgi:signal transduction histidine kinase
MGGLARGVRQRWALLRDLPRRNLRARVALGLGLPILLVLAGLSLAHYWRQRDLLVDQSRLAAAQIGQMVVAGLRHSMLNNDPGMAAAMLTDLDQRELLNRAQIVGLDGAVWLDSGPSQAGEVQHAAEPGCTACHRLQAAQRPAAALVTSDAAQMRIAVPIDNAPECSACHEAGAVHLGVLLADVPVALLGANAVRSLQTDLALSALVTGLAAVGIYGLMQWLVVRRVEAFGRPLAALAGGNFSARLASRNAGDELDQLAHTFNQMADRLQQHRRDEPARVDLRQRAIVEERERIARELHDGVAQVLGYVHTKATAVRLLLGRKQIEAAECQLAQLETAARGQFVGVREAILGLRMTSRSDLRLAGMLREYAGQFSQLSDLPVVVNIAPSVEALSLPAEAELQLLRIVQEALTNARKHAHARTAWVSVLNGGPNLEVSVSDDGAGFSLDAAQLAGGDSRQHYGLSTMRERAEAIGARFEVVASAGAGTKVTVRLSLEKGR